MRKGVGNAVQNAVENFVENVVEKRCGTAVENAVENAVEKSVENGVENFVSDPIFGAVKNAVENLWKIILRKSSEIRRILFTFSQRFSQRFSRCQFWHPISFSRLWKTRPPGSRAAREDHCSGEPRTVARDSRAACASSQCINNHQKSKKNLIFPQLFSGGRAGMRRGWEGAGCVV